MPSVAATTSVAPAATRPTMGAAIGVADTMLLADSTTGDTKVAKRLALAAPVEAACDATELLVWLRTRPMAWAVRSLRRNST